MEPEKGIKIDLTTRVIPKPSIVLREESDDWAMLFDPDSGKVFGINPVSVIVWKHLNNENSISDLLTKVYEKCSDVPDEVEQHILKFIGDLIESGMVEKVA